MLSAFYGEPIPASPDNAQADPQFGSWRIQIALADDAVSAPILGRTKAGLHPEHQRLRVVIGVSGDDTKAQAHPAEPLAGRAHGDIPRHDGTADLVGKSARGIDLRIGQDSSELPAAEPGDHPGFRDFLPDRHRDETQHLVPGHGAPRVVEFLEVVDVAQHQTDRDVAIHPVGHRFFEGLLECLSIGQPGYRVRHIGVADFLKLPAQVADFVDRRIHVLFEPALLIPDPAGRLHHVLDLVHKRLAIFDDGELVAGLRQIGGKCALGADNRAKRVQHLVDHLLDAKPDIVDAFAVVVLRNVFRTDLLDRGVPDGDPAG
jgi:hypothetical protein